MTWNTSFLVGDVVHILQFVKSSWNKFNYNNYIFVYILLDLTELRQTYLSSEKDEDSKQVSVISTDIGSIVATKDVECQFNYLVEGDLLQPVQLSIQHCVSLETQEHTSYLSFVTALL